MAAKKKKPEEKGAGAFGSTRSLRDDAEEQLARSPKISPDLAGQTPEEVIHELQVHKIELEMQAEELRRSHLALEESQEKYLDLYEFAPTGYFTFTDKAFITDVNLTGSMLLGVERSTLIGAPLSKFIAEKDSDQWHRFFVSVRRHVKKMPAPSSSNGETDQYSLPCWRGSGSPAAMGRSWSVLQSVTSRISGGRKRRKKNGLRN